MRFRKIRQGSWWRLGELCEVPGAHFEGDWGVTVPCTVFLVSCIFFNKCLYSRITWLDPFWADLILLTGYVQTARSERASWQQTAWVTNLILGLSLSRCARQSSSCCRSCRSSSDLVTCLSKGRDSATAEAAATNSGLSDSLLKKKMKNKWERKKRCYLSCH